ncbi:MAG: NAD(P)-binding domain-containing protein [Acidimicrobiia bacterium]|nr:NAD(P)-binding domain-containing protein [Acidimicrobiia bacterium]
MSTHYTAVIVGAGQAGLAMSRSLTDLSIDHIVLERGRIAERWQSERWDSLRLLTPNWMTRLPGYSYQGPDPDGYMTMAEVARFFQDYARSFDAPVQDETTVHSARATESGYTIETNHGTLTSRFLIAATGASATPNVPAMASSLPGRIHQTTPKYYKRPGDLPEGRVVVVGASASGVQLAREIHQSGRPVTLAVGNHVRLPRRYRGLNIHDWFDMMGTLDRRWDEIDDIEAARRAPSLQLVGSPTGETIDLALLQDEGVQLAGKVSSVGHDTIGFDGTLGALVADADQRQQTLLSRIDRWATGTGLDSEVDPIVRPERVAIRDEPRDLGLASVATVLWATGYRPDYSWIDLPIVGADGHIDHDGGVVRNAQGLYLMGMPMMRTRKSTYIDGVATDARDLSAHMSARLGRHAVERDVLPVAV